MLRAVILHLAAFGLGALAVDREPYSQVPIWGSIEYSTAACTAASTTGTKSYSVVPIDTWTPDPTSSIWGLGARTTLETKIAARAEATHVAGNVGGQVSDRDPVGVVSTTDVTPIQSGPGDCNGKTRRFNCISPGDKWQECSSGQWSNVIPMGKLGGVETTCTNYGVHAFLQLTPLPGGRVDTPVMTGPCNPPDELSASHPKRHPLAGLYNCIWPGLEWQTCSEINTWTDPAPMLGGRHCISYGVKDYMTTDDVPFN
ncbi:hypothetical protein QBC41DRAFT_298870 [Cercophora samala]|uniref:Uncharacterized protein n=1 Tax=Cercophora samala TaxID=330535 RepID=A0AA39ZLJ3_9PEZI|nr:hypothetical protein QBC41DRAFT_298870 [Cercophora samala]